MLLGWFADSADPDAGLLNFRKVSDALGKTPWYLRLLRDEGAAAREPRPGAVGRPRPRPADARPGGRGAARRRRRRRPGAAHPRPSGAGDPRRRAPRRDAEQAVTAARGVRRRELFRTAAADIVGSYGTEDRPAEADQGALVDRVGAAVSDLTAATLAGTLRAVVRDNWGDELPTRFAVIGMGRFGGHELGYGSDADVLFVHEPREGVDEREAGEAANQVVSEMRRLLQIPSADPPLLIDADLRPEGKSGPLARTLKSYEAYYRRWSLVWESQALLRAEPVAGDADLGRRFVELIDPLRYPAARARRGRRARDPAAEGPYGVRAAAPRRRPQAARQARSGRPVRRRVDRTAPSDAARRRPRGRCAPRGRARRWRRPARPG
ncbi:Bifunctional glutamine synthetase adenylyltransferase/adenylyl-removing enzyme [Streptomyces glaucescens]